MRTRWRAATAAAVLAALALVGAGCGGGAPGGSSPSPAHAIAVTGAQDRSVVKAAVGDLVEIRLPLDSASQTWRFKVDRSGLELVRQQALEPSPSASLPMGTTTELLVVRVLTGQMSRIDGWRGSPGGDDVHRHADFVVFIDAR